MKYTKMLFSLSVVAMLYMVKPVFALVPLTTIKPGIILNTVTPTPTTIIFKVPTLKFSPGLLNTATPTTSPTSTVTVTPTGEQVMDVAGEPQATRTSETISQSPTPTAAVTGTKIAGFTTKELVFGGMAVILLLALITQGNWEKIKTWLHERTK